ncbi:hypothetical protein WJX84_011161 [Apatococcus fuscideae]|uniref:Uncharacterized protein n=1 Tax=Apatococcus fuscideae TaxID=2026836 RepID=A0AAW1T1X2_9CHLO
MGSSPRPVLLRPLVRGQAPRELNCHAGRSCPGRFSSGALRTRRHIVVHAAAASSASKTFKRQYPLGKQNQLEVEVEQGEAGDQKDYQGGWRLPGSTARPDGTTQYKDRALQTPWRPNGSGQQLQLQFDGPEASEALNFVIKDNGTGRWYDYNGSNFHVPLSFNPGEEAEAAMSKPKESKAPATQAPLQDNQLPQLPDELCGIWAYITWEAAGCPNRSQEESSREFQNAIKELKDFLRHHVSVDELWKVAHGEIKYADFKRAQKEQPQAQAPPSSSPPAKKDVRVPEELVGIQAYIIPLLNGGGELGGAWGLSRTLAGATPE